MADIPIPQIRRVLFQDEEIGMGFHSDSGLAVGTPFDIFSISENQASSGQEASSEITIINSHEELMSSLGMSFEAQGRYGFISASMKATFSESSNFNSTSTFVVAKVIVNNAFRRGKDFHVSKSAQDLLDTNRQEIFTRAFGDSFVRGLQTGGEFYSVIRITSMSSTKQTELAATLQAEAQGLFVEGGFKAKFQEANKSSNTRSEFIATMYQKAGTGEQISPTVSIDEVIKRYKNFPVSVRDHPVAYETELATYDILPLNTPTAVEQEAFTSALVDARDTKLRYIETRNTLEFALRHSEFFQDPPSADTLMSATQTYTKLINAVTNHAVGLSRGEIKPPTFFDPSALSPPLVEPAPIALHRVAATVEVPNLLGSRLEDAVHTLDGLGLQFMDEPFDLNTEDLTRFPFATFAPDLGFLVGVIFIQSPASGAIVSPGSMVTLQVGRQ